MKPKPVVEFARRKLAEMTAPAVVRRRGKDNRLKTTSFFTADGRACEVRAAQLGDVWSVGAYCDGVRISDALEVKGRFDPHLHDGVLSELMIALEDEVHAGLNTAAR